MVVVETVAVVVVVDVGLSVTAVLPAMVDIELK